MDQKVFELTVEQQFDLKLKRIEFQGLTEKEIKQRLMETMELLMKTDNQIRSILKGEFNSVEL